MHVNRRAGTRSVGQESRLLGPPSRDTPVLLFDGHDGSTSDECGRYYGRVVR